MRDPGLQLYQVNVSNNRGMGECVLTSMTDSCTTRGLTLVEDAEFRRRFDLDKKRGISRLLA